MFSLLQPLTYSCLGECGHACLNHPDAWCSSCHQPLNLCLVELIATSQSRFWPHTTDCLVLQLNVYFTAQAVYKAFEGLFGGVKVLPGAFCLLRYTAVESLMAEYSLLPADDDIQAANELELGEDRFMTCLFLEHGWDVLYEPDAKAG